MKINVKEILKSEFAITEEKIEILAEKIKKAYKTGSNEIVLDFANVKASATRFFILVFKKLEKNFSRRKIRKIKVINAMPFTLVQFKAAKHLMAKK